MKQGFNISRWVDVGTSSSWIERAVEVGANFFRFGFVPDRIEQIYQLSVFKDFVKNTTYQMLELAAHVEHLPVKFMIDLHVPVGGLGQFNERKFCEKFWYDPEIQDVWISHLRFIASQVRDNSQFWGIEPCNEPTPPNYKIHKKVMRLAKKNVAEVNPDLRFVVPAKGVGPDSLATVPKLRGSAYTAHMYSPAKILTAPMFESVDLSANQIRFPRLERKLEAAIELRRSSQRVIIGETGAFPSVGSDIQRRYIKNVLRVCKKHRLWVCVYPFLDPQWKYDQAGILQAFGEVFGNG